MMELDQLISEHGPDIMKDRVIFQGEFPGAVYIIDRPEEGVTDVRLDYCTFYDQDNRRCSVYKSRPDICKTYGDPKYNCCPFEDFTEEGSLTKFLIENPNASRILHRDACSDPVAYNRDFVLPFVEGFRESRKENPEWWEWWESLTEANFIRQ
jgi:Fe-S-cluster containining protein